MKEFKLHNYTSLAQAITTVAQECNTLVNVAPKLAPYLDGVAVFAISRNAVLEAIKLDAAQHLPGFLDYLAAGVNLISTMPACAESDQALYAIEQVVTTLTNTHLQDGLRYVAYFQETGQFAITEEGKAALDAAITRLTETEEQTYELVVALHTHLAKNYNERSIKQFIPSNCLYGFSNELHDNGLVRQIKSIAAMK